MIRNPKPTRLQVGVLLRASNWRIGTKFAWERNRLRGKCTLRFISTWDCNLYFVTVHGTPHLTWNWHHFFVLQFYRDPVEPGDFFVGVMYMMEFSTPFVSIRFILSKLKVSDPPFTLSRVWHGWWKGKASSFAFHLSSSSSSRPGSSVMSFPFERMLYWDFMRGWMIWF
jgi:hypothetical protein